MLGDRISELRESRGLTQVDLAKRIGKSKQSISNWENNNILPSIEMLVYLSKFFNVSCDYLLELDNRRYLETDGLSESEICHIQQIIEDIRRNKSAP
jgi:transcriptional regulator with XRE-family HTH domain